MFKHDCFTSVQHKCRSNSKRMILHQYRKHCDSNTICLQKWCILNSLWYLNINWYILVDIECYYGIYGKKGPNETNSVLCSILYSDSHMTWKSHDRSGIFTVQYCTCVVWSVAVKTTVSMTVTCLTISLVKHCIVENGSCKFARSTQFLVLFMYFFLEFRSGNCWIF